MKRPARILTSLVAALAVAHAANGLVFDPPHDIACGQCHEPHPQMAGSWRTSTGIANLCLSCHNPVGIASELSFAPGDAADPFGTGQGSSHAWNVSAGNVRAGAQMPQNASLSRKLVDGVIVCTTCHDPHYQARGRPLLRTSNTADAQCRDCHRTRDIGRWQEDPLTHVGSHPIGMPIPTNRPAAYRSPAPGETYLPLSDGNVVCTTCHGVHATPSTPTRLYVATGGSTNGLAATIAEAGWTPDALAGQRVFFPGTGTNSRQHRFVVSNSAETLYWTQSLPAAVTAGTMLVVGTGGAGDGMLLRSANDSDLCLGCHTYPEHPQSSPVHGCLACHRPHGTTNILLVTQQIRGVNVRLQGVSASDLVHGAPLYDGVCEVCHTSTRFHRNDASGNHAHGLGGNCLQCHRHDRAFAASCEDCHAATPETLATGSHAAHFTDTRGPKLTDCTMCHGAGSDEGSHAGHMNGIVNVGVSTNGTLATTRVCDDCHSPGGLVDGADDTALGAKANWSNGVYTVAGELRPGLGNWCLGCHDDDPGTESNESSVVRGVVAPAVAGDGVTYGFLVTGHGRAAGSYPPESWQTKTAAGNPAAGLMCTTCHSTLSNHIDGVTNSMARLLAGFAPGQDNAACTQCHGAGGTADHAPAYFTGGTAFEASAHSAKLCSECHDVHGAAGAFAAMARASEESLCYQCHTDEEDAFDLDSHHDVAVADQVANESRVECTMCHNPHLATSTEPLVDPDDPVTPWTTLSPRDFCLACHDGDAPDAVAFPANHTGTGWDQSAFVDSRHDVVLGGDCTLCHNPHGSDNVSTLLSNMTLADDTDVSEAAYQLCFDCHSYNVVMTKENAFKEHHKKHVNEESTPCINCHNAHAPHDAGESGLIDLTFPVRDGRLTLRSGYTLSTAFADTGTNKGSCNLTCHQEEHEPESYTGVTAATVDCLTCHDTAP